MPVVEINDLRKIIPKGSRLLGVDHSPRRIGLALSNPDMTIATPLRTLSGKNFTENLKLLSGIIKEYAVGGLVIGLPLNMDGSEGARAQSVRHFGLNLIRAKATLGFDPPIAYIDERLSTFGAEQLLIDDLNMPRHKRQEIIDAQAACDILSGALKILTA